MITEKDFIRSRTVATSATFCVVWLGLIAVAVLAGAIIVSLF